MFKEFKSLISLINSKTIIGTILIIFIGSIPAIFMDSLLNANLFNQLINCFTNNFHLLLLILAISINIISLSSELKKSNIILRHKNYRNYLEFCLRKNLMYVVLTLIISFFFCLFTSLISVDFKIEVISYYYYDISNLTYFLFTLIKTVVFMNLISFIIFYFNQKFKNKITLGFIILILLTFFIPINLDGKINSIFKMPILIGHWFYSLPYSSFLHEILVFFVQSLILLLIGIVLKYLVSYKKQDI